MLRGPRSGAALMLDVDDRLRVPSTWLRWLALPAGSGVGGLLLVAATPDCGQLCLINPAVLEPIAACTGTRSHRADCGLDVYAPRLEGLR